ncbi:MAG: GAF domain-containing protein [Anaerolineales bacterium]|nr:GAF domain-containing protein [Anaerolineales bacterium]
MALFPLPYPALHGWDSIISSGYLQWQVPDYTRRYCFQFLMLGITIWTFGYALELAAGDLAAKIFWAKFQFFGVVIIPLSWLAFAHQYTGQARPIPRPILTVFILEAIITLVLIWTNEAHGLAFRETRLLASGPFLTLVIRFGPLIWVHVAYTYLLLLLGTGRLILMFFGSLSLHRWQVGLLILGALFPWLANVLFLWGLGPIPGLDLSPFAFAISGLIFAWDLARLRFLEIVPIAHELTIASMTDSLLVLDKQNRVTYLNPAARKAIGSKAAQVVGQPANLVLADYRDLVERYHDTDQLDTEVTLEVPSAIPGSAATEKVLRHYNLRVFPIQSRDGQSIGRVIQLRDITTLKTSEESLFAQKQLFESLANLASATTTIGRSRLLVALQNVLDQAGQLTKAESGGLFLLADEKEPVVPLIYGQVAPESSAGLKALVSSKGLASWVMSHNQSTLVADTGVDERWSSPVELTPPVRSALVIPLVSGPLVLGILTLLHSRPDHFHSEQLQLLQVAADQMSLALRNARTFEMQRRIARQQATLYEVLREVAGRTDLGNVAAVAIESIGRVAGWTHALLAMPSDDNQHWFVAAAGGVFSNSIGQKVSLRQGLISRVFKTGQLQVVPDVTADPDHLVFDAGLRSGLIVPLQRHGRTLGVLNLESSQPAAFSPDDIRLAESLGEIVALALDNAHLHQNERARRHELEAVQQASLSLISLLELPQVLDAILQTILDLVSPHRADIFLYLEERLVFGAAASREAPQSQPFIEPRSEGLTYRVARHGEPVFVPNLSLHPLYSARSAEIGPATVVALPLKIGARVVGVLDLFWMEPDSFAEARLPVLRLLADQAAIAIENARLYAALRQSEERYALAARGANDGLWDWDLQSNQIYFSPRWKAMLGYEEDEIGRDPEEWFKRVHRSDREEVKTEISAHLSGLTSHFESEYRLRHKDGSYLWVLNRGLAIKDAEGRATRMAGSQTDVTERKQAEEQLQYDAFYDGLTGMPNRALFMDHLERSLGQARRRTHYLLAVLFMDLDRFKVVNESLGHAIGDQLLVEVGHRLQSCIRTGDTMAHLGGDKFALLLDGIQRIGEAKDLADQIQYLLARPMNLNGQEVFISVSIGVVSSLNKYNRADEMLRDAEVAMYQAKALGRARYELLKPACMPAW